MIIGASSFAGNLQELTHIVDSIELYIPKIGIYKKRHLQREEVEKLKDILSTQNINTTIHAPYYAETPSYPKELSVDTAHMSKADLKLMYEAVDLAEQFNAQIVVIHPGRIIENREKSLKQMIDNLRRLADYAAEHSVTLGLENKEGSDPENLCTYPEELLTTLEAVGCDNLAITLDIGHANLTCRGDQQALKTFTETLIDETVHLHIHDNSGEKTPRYHGDHHGAIGTGCIDFNILRTLKYKGIYNLEMFSIEDVRGSKTLLKNLLDAHNTQHYNSKSV
jgi:sugar phosphate isomerase/epimerase